MTMSDVERFQSVEKNIIEARMLGKESLIISGMWYSELPSSIGDLTNLRKLDVSVGKLTQLPESLSNLTELRSLNLSHNKFTDIPPFLVKLKNLEQLLLHDNPLNPELAESRQMV